jgi:hypothetical protein
MHHGGEALHVSFQIERMALDARSISPFQPSRSRNLKALRYQKAAACTAAPGKDNDYAAAYAPLSGMGGTSTVFEKSHEMVRLVKVRAGKGGFRKGQMMLLSHLGLGLVSGSRVREWVLDRGYSVARLLLPNVIGVGKGIRKSSQFLVREDRSCGGIYARCSWM